MTRRTRPSLQLSLALTVLILLAVLAGCGYKDKPVPPSQIVPKAVTDLQYQLDEKGVTLYWSYPRETVTGDKLIDIASFDLYRAVVPANEYCETCPIPFASPIDLPGGALPDKGARRSSAKSKSPDAPWVLRENAWVRVGAANALATHNAANAKANNAPAPRLLRGVVPCGMNIPL